MKYIPLLMILLFGYNCEKHEISKIKLSYIPGIIESPFSNSCDSSISDWNFSKRILDTVITNQDILKDIEDEIQKLKAVDSIFPVNGRIFCTVYFLSDSTSKICLGSLIGTIYNGRQVIDNENLNYLLKKYSGYYYYIPLDLVLGMPEIKKYPKRLADIRNEDTNYYKLGEPEPSGDSLIEIQHIGAKHLKRSK